MLSNWNRVRTGKLGSFEAWRTRGLMPAEGLPCKLYAMIPLGWVTADQDMVNGTTPLAPLAGARPVGAAGPCEGVTLSVAGFVTPPKEPEIVTEVGEGT